MPQQELAPARLFAEHVEAVRADDDPLDIQRRLWYGPSGTDGAIAGGISGLITGEAMSTGVGNVTLSPTVYGTGIAVATLLAISRVRRRHHLAAGRERYDLPTQEAVGQSYELYTSDHSRRDKTTKVRTIDMRWYGPADGDAQKLGDGLDNLTYMAVLAKQSGIRKIAVGDGLLRRLVANPEQPKHSMADVLKRAGLRIGGRAKTDMVHDKTPDEWLQTVRQERLERGYSLESMLAAIEGYKYDHPLARIRREYASGSSLFRNDALLRVSRMGTERQFDDIWGTKDAFGIPVRHHIRGSLTPDGTYVHQFNDGTYNTTTSLDNALGMSNEALQAAIDGGETNPNAAVRALEVMVFKKLKQLETAATEEAAAANRIKDDVVPYQAEILKLEKVDKPDRIRLRSLRIRRAATFLVAASIVGAAAGLGTYALNNEYYKKQRIEHEAIAKERGIDPDVLEYDDPELLTRLGPLEPWALAQPTLEGAVNMLGELPGFQYKARWPHFPYEMGWDFSGAPLETNIGDIDSSSPNTPQWSLTGVNMSTGGYWATGVANNMYMQPTGRDEGIFTRWAHDEARDHNLIRTDLPTSVPEGISQYVTVQRLLSYQDIGNQDPGKPIHIYIPVLEGTKPVGASIDGHSLKLVERQDGTYYFETPDASYDIGTNMSGTLSYWVAPTADAATPRFVGKTYASVDIIDTDPQAVDRAWDSIIPGLPAATNDPTTDAERTRMIGEYIQQNWQYKLQPWGNGVMAGVNSLSAQVIQANKAAAANCNVVANLLVQENPRLAPVMGFLNEDGSPLSSHDSHMWVTDTAGNRMDYTPSNGISAEDAKFFEENYKGDPNKTGGNLWLYGQLALLAAGAAAWRRKDIARGVRFAAGELAAVGEKRLARMPIEDLKLAVELAQRAAFAPVISVPQAQSRVKYVQGDPKDIVGRLLNPQSGLLTTRTQRALKVAARQAADAVERRQLQTTARTVRRARRVSRHSNR